MLLGIGIDGIEVARVGHRLSKENGLKQQLFTPGEIAHCDSKIHSAQNYAARFAAKEAFLKAVGCGLHDGLLFREIEVVNDYQSQPHLVLHGAAKQLAEANGVTNIHVSLSHTKMLAGAIVTLET